MNISFTKTKTQVFHDEELAQKDTLFSVEDHTIENVREFVYLGQVFTNTQEKSFTEHRIARATAKFNELRKALCDRDINIQTRRKMLEACVRSRLTYGLQACYPKESEMKKLESCWVGFMRRMVRGGWKRREPENEDEEEYSFVYTNERIRGIIQAMPLRSFIEAQYLKYIGHVCRSTNSNLTKIMLFAQPSRRYFRDPWIRISRLLGVSSDQSKMLTQTRTEFAALIRERTKSPLQR